jgi:hypothetical protein
MSRSQKFEWFTELVCQTKRKDPSKKGRYKDFRIGAIFIWGGSDLFSIL